MIAGASTGDVVLSIRSVSARRGRTKVLDHVSFDVVDRIREGCITGQVVTLLGRSGIGKSTLLRIIAGLDRADGGEIIGPQRGGVGIVFQDYPLLMHRTILDNLIVAGKLAGLDRDRAGKRAMELLVRIGLEDRAEAWPAQLSGGQRQRVAIAQQLVSTRRYLLLDEPFSGLDPKNVDEVSSLITEVANEHELNTVVIVTHDVRAALGVSDTILLLGGGADGARVVESWDLVERGIAWHEGNPNEVAIEIERRFREV